MAKKRAPGGGRKPKGPFSGLTAPLTIRMPPEMRKELETAAKKRGKNLTQELLWRLRASFDRERDKVRDPALRAFSFLFSELVQVICFNPNSQLNWRFDPWLFHAIKLAIVKLLDRFEPKGKVNLPEFWQFFVEMEGYPITKAERARITRSPEAMAEYAVQRVLSDFIRVQGEFKDFYEGKFSDPFFSTPLNRVTVLDLIEKSDATYYGMINAQRDLSPKHKPQGKKS